MGHLLESIEFTNVIQSGERWRQTTMGTEDLTLNNCCKWEVIKEIGEHFPDVIIFVFPDAFVIESITLGDWPGFVVASQNGDSVFVSESEKQYLIFNDSIKQIVSTE